MVKFSCVDSVFNEILHYLKLKSSDKCLFNDSSSKETKFVIRFVFFIFYQIVM